MKNKYIVTKSNNLITAKYSLSLEEQRIILVLASMVQPEDKKFKSYKFKIKDFLNLINVKDENKYIKLPQITKGLLDKKLDIHYKIKGEDALLQTSWLSSVEYYSGYIELEFSPKLKPFLLGLKEFYTTYKLNNILNLKSKYSIRMYEILKSCQFKKIEYISVDELKSLLAIDSKYTRFYDIKTKIIDKAKAELEQKTDIQFTYQEIKQGRVTSSLKFFVFPNKSIKDSESDVSEPIGKPNNFEKQHNSYTDEDVCEIKQQIEGLTKGDITFKVVCNLLDNKGIDKLRYYLDNYKKFKISKHNPIGFLIKAIMEEYPIPNKEKNNYNQKPIQSTNFQQREYDDEYFDSLYDNFKDNPK